MVFLSFSIGSWYQFNKIENQDINIGNKSVYAQVQVDLPSKEKKWYHLVNCLYGKFILKKQWREKPGITEPGFSLQNHQSD